MAEGKRWALPICTGCGGILGYKLSGGCTCDPSSHAKTGKSIEVLPVSEHEAALAKARAEVKETLLAAAAKHKDRTRLRIFVLDSLTKEGS